MDAEPMSETDAVRLERGEVLTLDRCPFPLPSANDLAFLRSPEIREKTYHDIQFDPTTRGLSGIGTISVNDRQRMVSILADFSYEITHWLTSTFPFYATDLILDQATVRVHEEATRSLRHSGRNDLLHIDSFPARPTGGRRALRIYVNFNEMEDRVWAIGETFPALLDAIHRDNESQRGTGRNGWIRRSRGSASCKEIGRAGRPTTPSCTVWKSF